MSGNFTQRGEPALIDKWSRATAAINAGIDLVIELPTIYSISSAENFSYGAIKILDSLKIVDYVSFGSEAGNIEILNKIADILYNEPKEYKTILSHELSKGISYPQARENALLMYLNDIRKYANVLSSPNNILGIEYLKAIKRLKSTLEPITISRKLAPHSQKQTYGEFASSSAIREIIKNEGDYRDFVPTTSYKVVENQKKYGKIISDISIYEKEIIYAFRKMDIEELKKLPDVSEGLEYKIKEVSRYMQYSKRLFKFS